MQNENLEIVMTPVNRVIPYWRNPRRNDKTVDALVSVIEKNGFNVPIVVDKNGVVVKGHARLKAAKRLGMSHVPCIVSNAPEDVIKADRIADNKIQELSSWDFGKLNVELENLSGKMSFERLFKPEDAPAIDEIPQIDFKPAALDFGFEFDDVAPKSDAVAFEQKTAGGTQDVGFTGAYNPVDVATEVPERKCKKMLCPYCGKEVILYV